MKNMNIYIEERRIKRKTYLYLLTRKLHFYSKNMNDMNMKNMNIYIEERRMKRKTSLYLLTTKLHFYSI